MIAPIAQARFGPDYVEKPSVGRRRLPLFLIGSMIAVAISIPRPSAAATDRGICLRPGGVWWERYESPPEQLRRDSAYLFHRTNPAGMRIPLPRAGIGWTIALSPRGGLVAYDVNHTGDPSFHRESVATYEVAVSDTTGRDVISFARGIRLAWRRDGKALAIAIGSARWPSELVLDSIVIWEPGKGTTLTCRVPLSRGLIGWAGHGHTANRVLRSRVNRRGQPPHRDS